MVLHLIKEGPLVRCFSCTYTCTKEKLSVHNRLYCKPILKGQNNGLIELTMSSVFRLSSTSANESDVGSIIDFDFFLCCLHSSHRIENSLLIGSLIFTPYNKYVPNLFTTTDPLLLFIHPKYFLQDRCIWNPTDLEVQMWFCTVLIVQQIT